jgi:hypothetical protein
MRLVPSFILHPNLTHLLPSPHFTSPHLRRVVAVYRRQRAKPTTTILPACSVSVRPHTVLDVYLAHLSCTALSCHQSTSPNTLLLDLSILNDCMRLNVSLRDGLYVVDASSASQETNGVRQEQQ